MKIAIVDTYYPQFLSGLKLGDGSYGDELLRVLGYQFGTADFVSANLRKLGWSAIDIVANYEPLQRRWAADNDREGAGSKDIVWEQFRQFQPEVIFMQDLSYFNPMELAYASRNHVLAGQLSCPWPGDERVKQFDVLFTSLPTYVPRIEKLGVRAVYNPLAFDTKALDGYFDRQPSWGLGIPKRIHDCVFIGGVGAPSHWRYGMEVLTKVSEDIPTFKWWGYGEVRPSDLLLTYQGKAWGRDMYAMLLRSKICLNRHGEVAEGYSNNMRMFEATGCGALLLTEDSKNIRDFFTEKECVTYSSPQDAVDKIRYYLDHDDERAEIAANGQKRTLSDHTYEKRMATVSATLQEMLCPA